MIAKLSTRKRDLHILQSISGSLKLLKRPEASQTLDFLIIELSNPKLSSNFLKEESEKERENIGIVIPLESLSLKRQEINNKAIVLYLEEQE